MMLDYLRRCQMGAVSRSMTILWNNGLEPQRQRAANGSVHAKLCRKTGYNDLCNTSSRKRCAERGVEKRITGILGNPEILSLDYQISVQSMTGLRRMQWIALRAAMLNEYH